MLRRLLLVTLLALGCSDGGGTASDLAATKDLATNDLAQAGSSCSAPADCRLYSDNCDQCACEALRTDQVDPVCNGTQVSCFVDPCNGKSADCQGGHCVVK
jgi:hypothetical protein